MATQEQYSPFIEEGHEENKRLYDKDKKHSFVPIEEVPDDALLPDQFEDREKIEEENEPEDDEEDDSDLEYVEPTREERIETLEKEIKQGYSLFGKQKLAELLKQPAEKPLGYMRDDGVASVGPDIIEDVPVATEAELDPVLPGANDVEDGRALREKVSDRTAEPKKWNMLRYKDDRKDRENQKTITSSKRERSARSWLSRLLNGEDKTKEKKIEEIHEAMHEEIFDLPEDPFKYEDENKAA